MIRDEPDATVTSEPSLPPSSDPKGKRTCFPSHVKGEEKAKKSKRSSLPSNLASSSSKAPVIEMAVEVAAPPDLEVATLAGVSKTPEGKEKELVTIEET